MANIIFIPHFDSTYDIHMALVGLITNFSGRIPRFYFSGKVTTLL